MFALALQAPSSAIHTAAIVGRGRLAAIGRHRLAYDPLAGISMGTEPWQIPEQKGVH